MTKLIESSLPIVLATVAFHFLIYISIEKLHLACCNFQPFRSLWTNICTYPRSHFTLLAIRRPSLRESLWDTLETVLPLSLLQRLGISSGNVSELGVIRSNICSRCFVIYDTVTGENGLHRHLKIRLGSIRLLSLTPLLTVVMLVSRM